MRNKQRKQARNGGKRTLGGEVKRLVPEKELYGKIGLLKRANNKADY